ncbi:MAG: metallophosphoesterase family protein [Bacillota bacterium]
MKSVPVPLKRGFSILSVARAIGIALTLAAGVMLLVSLLGPVTREVEGFKFRVGLEFGCHGKSVLELPPFGSLSASTHSGPLTFKVTLTEIEAEAFGDILMGESAYHEVIDAVRSDLEGMMPGFATRQVVLGGLGAAILVWLFWRMDWRRVLVAGLGGVFLTGALLAYSVYSFNMDAFREPEYHGAVATASRILDLAQDLASRVQNIKENTGVVINNLQNLSGKVKSLALISSVDEKNVTRVLLISDLHSNPVGFRFVGDIVKEFNVEYVIDAGDLTDFGSPLEVRSASEIRAFGVPYLFAPGNHDTPDVMRFVISLPNGRVLRGNPERIGQLEVLGAPDSLSFSSAVAAKSEQEEMEGLARQNEQLRKALDNGTVPDLLVTHDPRAALPLLGRVKVIVNGHTHRISCQKHGDTVILNPGTSGAAGIRGLNGRGDSSYSAIMTYWHGKRLAYVDLIEYHALSGRFSVERRMIDSYE